MESLNPAEVLKYLEFVNDLKHLPRRGWIFSKVKDHETISGHMYAMGLMTFLLGNDSKLDRLKCLQLTLVHDLAEAIVGDITPHDNVPEDVKHQKEDEAMKEITSHIGEAGKLIYNLYKEYEAKETPEAKFVKDLDRFDLLFTAASYEKRDNAPLKCQEYFDEIDESKFTNPYVKKLVVALKESRLKTPNSIGMSEPH
ncbi:5'-deoxynucleotidase HDDC2 [Anthonomus grandis grandis]|uniref:5'-deoxynucleotidase HDDC2 n=1 Tax=Anthonomus grandis grandis TaxID=2921223 RepID=UPI002166740B|nr:5'-deoxynucleotidase HDDC2 [Anthonomus grandis grandis]XP_050305964.1 5'-deoxynucleotidase HDDC2 [Anthonomus grandis grandis]